MSAEGRLSIATQGMRGWIGAYAVDQSYFIAVQGFGETQLLSAEEEYQRRGGGGQGGRNHEPRAVILPPRRKAKHARTDKQERDDGEIALLISIIGRDP